MGNQLGYCGVLEPFVQVIGRACDLRCIRFNLAPEMASTLLIEPLSKRLPRESRRWKTGPRRFRAEIPVDILRKRQVEVLPDAYGISRPAMKAPCHVWNQTCPDVPLTLSMPSFTPVSASVTSRL